jgi:hypothetical protein
VAGRITVNASSVDGTSCDSKTNNKRSTLLNAGLFGDLLVAENRDLRFTPNRVMLLADDSAGQIALWRAHWAVAVHRGAPVAAIAFNMRPEDSADAAARWMPHDPAHSK